MQYIKESLNLFVKYKELLIQLVIKDIKLKYRRSFLGYVWSILNPLMTMTILVVVFQHMFRFSIENYPAYVISGQVCFNFISESTSQAIFSIVGNASLLKKTYVPKYIFTLARVSSSCVNLLFSLGALGLVFLFTGMKFSFYMLLLPFILAQLFMFSLGLGLILAAVNVFFRDIQYIYNALIMVWMYLTPIFYPLDMLPEYLQWAIKHCNPLYFYLGQFRDVMIYHRCPGNAILFAGVIAAIVSLMIGTVIFGKLKDRFILYI